MANNNYDKKGAKYSPSDGFWKAETTFYPLYEQKWFSYIDQLERLRPRDTDEAIQCDFDQTIEKLRDFVRQAKSYTIEEGDIVKVNMDKLREDHNDEKVSAHFFVHVRDEVEESMDGTLTVHRINKDEAFCYSTGKDADIHGLDGPMIDDVYLILYNKNQ